MPDLGDAQSFLDLGEAAVDKEFGSVDEVRRVGGKEYCGFGDTPTRPSGMCDAKFSRNSLCPSGGARPRSPGVSVGVMSENAITPSTRNPAEG